MSEDSINKSFYFIRHGETEWNRKQIYMGSQDIPLNKTGEGQALRAAYILEKENIKHIVSSPLIRATKTAEIIAKVINTDVTIIKELAECSWGEYEGKPVDDGAILKRWFEGKPHYGAEPIEDFERRVMNGFNLALKLEEPVLIVAHGGVYCAIQRALDLPFVKLKNCIPIFHRPPVHTGYQWDTLQIEIDDEK